MNVEELCLAEDDCQEGLLGGFPTTGKAFLTFETAEGALRFLSAASNASESGLLGDSLEIEKWNLSPAPPQSDVQWDVMYMPQSCRLILLFTINIAIIVMLLLFTTPTAVRSSSSKRENFYQLTFSCYHLNHKSVIVSITFISPENHTNTNVRMHTPL